MLTSVRLNELVVVANEIEKRICGYMSMENYGSAKERAREMGGKGKVVFTIIVVVNGCQLGILFKPAEQVFKLSHPMV